MSAFLVGKEHIDALVTVARCGPKGIHFRYGWRDCEADPTATGKMLLRENAQSVGYRYSEPCESVDGYVYRESTRRMTLPEALKALACYEYQACEHPEWPASAAYRWCAELRASLCHYVTGWEAADGWEWTHA